MIAVRSVRPQDLPTLVALIEEMDAFYGAVQPAPRDEQEAAVRSMIFRANPAAHVLVAWDGTKLVGMVAYSFLWPAVGVTQSLFLKELYVSGAARHRGVGKTLMDELRTVAVANGCSRLEWTTDAENLPAQGFYVGLGVEPKTDKLFYRMEL